MRQTSSSHSMWLILLALPVIGCGGDVSGTDPSDSAFDPQAISNPKNVAWVRPTDNKIKCVTTPCPCYSLQGVNGGTSHTVDRLDVSGLKLSSAMQAQILAQADGVLLHGRYTQASQLDSMVQAAPPIVFVVDSALAPVAQSQRERPMVDTYYQVADNGVRCITTPCPSLTATVLGTARQETWNDVDLRPLGLSAAAQAVLMQEIRSPEGTVKLSMTEATSGKVVTSAFRPFGAKPLPASSAR